jgi:hypothetical protein
MKVLQMKDNGWKGNNYKFCVEQRIGFTWKYAEGDIRHPIHISIDEYKKLDSDAQLLGDFNENTK